MTEDAPVRFYRSATDDEAHPPQSAAQELQDSLVDPVIWGALSTDPRVAGIAGRGWCLFAPVDVTINPDTDQVISPTEATDYVSVQQAQSNSDMVSVTLDTLWTVEITEPFSLLVLPWVGSIADWVAPQLVTADDGPVELEVPITTTDVVNIDEETPIVQLIPLTEALLSATSEAGVPPEEVFDQFR